ncbi:MAG: NUDIX domain-containing protein [Anaerolineales bacterium]|jgi:ADP-ribose pyrophosphatase YjhB (NUDIX family)
MAEEFNQPSIGIGTAIIKDGKILLTKRRDFPVWCIPGGHLTPGESILEAAVREAKEETGFDVTIQHLIGIYSMPYKWENGSCEIIFRAKPIDGVLLSKSDETTDAGFFSENDFPEALIGWQYHQAMDALQDQRGVVAVLDAKLSIRQFREIDGRIKSGEKNASAEWLEQVCEIPARIDLGG